MLSPRTPRTPFKVKPLLVTSLSLFRSAQQMNRKIILLGRKWHTSVAVYHVPTGTLELSLPLGRQGDVGLFAAELEHKCTTR